MLWIIGGGLWFLGGALFISRILRFDTPEDDPHQLADGDHPFIPLAHSLAGETTRSAAGPGAPGFVLIKDGLNEPRRVSSFHGRTNGNG